MAHVGMHVRFTPAKIPAKLAEDGKKVLEPEHQPPDQVAQITKVHSEVCVNLMVIEEGEISPGTRFTSVSVGTGSFSFGLLPRSHYASPYLA